MHMDLKNMGIGSKGNRWFKGGLNFMRGNERNKG